MSHSDNNNFCALPFAHTLINVQGTYQICCRHPTPKEHAININHAPLEQWKKSKYYLQVKDSFLKNEKHPGCKNCWDLESLGQQSMRKRTSKDFQIMKVNKQSDRLYHLEIQLGNLCNLSCLMCSEMYSSAISAENKKLGIKILEQKDLTWTGTAFINLNKILTLHPRIISIAGGEPLYSKQLLTLLHDLPVSFCKRTVLNINTNATVWHDHWEQVMQKFKLVRFTFSLDGTMGLYEYIRYPSSWNTVMHNIQQIVKMHNVKSQVNCVVQNLNICYLSDIIKWCRDNNIWITLSQLSNPSFLRLTNLPPSLKTQAITNLEKCQTFDNLSAHTAEFVKSCQTQLLESQQIHDSGADWEKCVSYLNMRDQVRNNSHKKFLTY